MCGIAGVVSFDSSLRIMQEHLMRMSSAIAHRGPDGHNLHLTERSPQIGMAFRRLAVLDPDPRSMQPMSTPDGRFTLVFNGEIYNYRDLRAQFPGHPWQTTGDTEVLLHILSTNGMDGIERLEGMFAFALWDETKKSLLLARDRMGQKPLYYAIGRSSISFASELRALDAWPDWDQGVSTDSLGDYLRFGYVPSPRTMLCGARQLLPGHSLLLSGVGDDQREQRQYFDCNDRVIHNSSTPFKQLIEQAVQKQLVSDVPLGVFLSGGIDSSIIARCAKLHGKVSTFSIGFGDPRYDETAFAREVAKHLGTDHHEFRVTPDAAADLPRIAEVFGDPFADSSALPTHYLAKQTRQYVTVALSGDGGDELFGGYDRYVAMDMKIGWLAPISFLGRTLSRGHPKSRLTRAGRLLASAGLSEAKRYLQYISICDDQLLNRLLGGDQKAGDFEHTWRDLRQSRDPVETALAIDRISYLPNDLLTKVDRASMLHALEVRSPFMDHTLVAHAAILSRGRLIGSGKKAILRDAFAADLPASVFARPKMGFAVPIGDWFRAALKPLLIDHLQASNSLARQHLHLPTIDQLIAQHLSGKVDRSQVLYALLMLELWHRTRCP
jgi:asparagine synthase (glutamine-hydrolysing)